MAQIRSASRHSPWPEPRLSVTKYGRHSGLLQFTLRRRFGDFMHFLKFPRASGSGTRRPATLQLRRHFLRNTWVPGHGGEGRWGPQQKKETKRQRAPASFLSEALFEVGLLQRGPLGCCEQPPCRRRDFFATEHVELLAGSPFLEGGPGCLFGGFGGRCAGVLELAALDQSLEELEVALQLCVCVRDADRCRHLRVDGQLVAGDHLFVSCSDKFKVEQRFNALLSWQSGTAESWHRGERCLEACLSRSRFARWKV